MRFFSGSAADVVWDRRSGSSEGDFVDDFFSSHIIFYLIKHLQASP